MAVIVGALAGACTSATAAHAPIAAPCTPNRVGTVTVTGAPRSLVPGLAVLEGTLDARARTARPAAAATEQLRWRGYPHATIAITRRTGCFTDLHVAVKLGDAYRISRIEFVTDDTFPAADRLAALEDGLGTVNTVGGVHIPYRLQRALAALQRRYRDAGWLDAWIDKPSVTYARGEIRIKILVDAGPRYRVGAIRATAASARARAVLLAELGAAAGGWYDESTILTRLDRARRKLERHVELRTSVARAGLVELEAIVEAAP